MENIDLCLKVLVHGLDEFRNSIPILFNAATTLLVVGNTLTPIIILKKCLFLMPYDPFLYYNLLLAQLLQGDMDQDILAHWQQVKDEFLKYNLAESEDKDSPSEELCR